MTWVGESFAKINLGLHVLARLPNGYHVIETGIISINWADRFIIKKAKQTRLELTDLSIPNDHTNLISKAIVLLRAAGLSGDYNIEVKKRVPAGAGLGGGSANAAFTLNAFNQIENLGLTREELHNFAAKLGSDVPYFLTNDSALAEGTGTRLSPLPIKTPFYIVTASPGSHSSTAEAYSYCEPENERMSLKTVLNSQDPIDDWPLLLQNDLEPAVISRLPEVGLFKDRMMEMGAFYSAMTGSGSAVFGLFEQEFVAAEANASFIELGYTSSLTPPEFKPDTAIYTKES